MEFPVPAAIIICFCFWGAVCRITITFFRPAASLWIITPKHFRTAGWLLQTKISTNFNTICVICLSVWGITSDLCASIIINRAVTFYWFPCTAIRITFVLIVAETSRCGLGVCNIFSILDQCSHPNNRKRNNSKKNNNYELFVIFVEFHHY